MVEEVKNHKIKITTDVAQSIQSIHPKWKFKENCFQPLVTHSYKDFDLSPTSLG